MSIPDSGRPIMRLANVDFAVFYDAVGMAVRIEAQSHSASAPAYYPSGSDKSIFDIHAHDLLVHKKPEGGYSNTGFAVLSVANGLGRDEIRTVMSGPKRPMDENCSALIKDAIKMSLVPVGVAVTNFPASRAGVGNNQLTATIGGLETIPALAGNINTGSLVCMDLPDLDFVNMPGKSAYRGNRNRYPMVAKMYNPEQIGVTVARFVTEAIGRPRSWAELTRVGSPRGPHGVMWAGVVDTIIESSLVQALMAIYVLVQANVLGPGQMIVHGRSPMESTYPSEFYAPGRAENTPRFPTHATDRQALARDMVVTLAKGLGIIRLSNLDMSEFTAGRKLFYAHLKPAILRAMFQDNRSVISADIRIKSTVACNPHNPDEDLLLSTEFGYHKGVNLGINTTTNQIKTDVAAGQLLFKQLNAFSRSLGGYNKASTVSHSWVLGKCVKGAVKGQNFDLVLGTCRQ